MYMVKAIVNGKLAGIGRVVGDFSIVCMLSDICVKPEFQGKGIGLKIVNELKKLIEDGVKDGEKIQIELTPTAGNEEFYKKAGFKYKPDVITGMYLWIKKWRKDYWPLQCYKLIENDGNYTDEEIEILKKVVEQGAAHFYDIAN